MKRQLTTNVALLVVLLPLFVASCSDSSNDPDSGSRVVVSPNAILLTSVGESYQFAADVTGDPMEAEVSWESSRPDVEIDQEGNVRSTVAVGSAMITAIVDGVRSQPALVVIGEPAGDALLVNDDQVAQLPIAVDPNGTGDIGTQFTIVLSGVDPPSPGSLVLAREASPIAGRVVTSEPRGGNVVVTLEAVPLTELFRNLDIKQAFPVATDDLVLDNPDATLTREADGSLTIDLPPDEGDEVVPARKQTGGSSFSLGGGIECKASARPALRIRSPSVNFNPEIDFDSDLVIRDGSLQRLLIRVNGSITATLNLRAQLVASFRGTASCRLPLGKIRLPIGGVLAAFVTPAVPFGLGTDLEGALEVAELEFGATATLSAEATLGFEYTALEGLRSLNDFDTNGTFTPFVDFPESLFEDLRITGSVHGYAWAGFDVVALPILELLGADLDLPLFDLTFGPKLGVSFATLGSQVNDASYASEYELLLFGKAGLSQEVKDALKWFGGSVEIIPVEFRFESGLFRSPQGTLSASTLNATTGMPIDLRVELDDETVDFFRVTSPLLGEYSVREVRFYKVDDGIELIDSITPTSSGQTEFLATWRPDEQDEGLNTFAAFVLTEEFTLLDFFPLEIAADSRIIVNVRAGDDPPTGFGVIGAFEDVNGLRSSRAHAINDQGLVAGFSTGTPQGKAFRWQPGVALVDLGSPVSEPQDAASLGGFGINSVGHVAGTFRSTFVPMDGMAPKFTDEQPFVWRGGTMESLNESVDTDVWRQLRTATDINDDGSVVGLGIFFISEQSTRGRGYIWRDGEATNLGTIGNDTNVSMPNAINNSDQVVGAIATPSGNPQKIGFLWENGGLQEIKSESFAQSEALDINNEGQIVGWVGSNISNGQAFLWLPEPAYDLPAGLNLLEFPGCVGNPAAGTGFALNDKGQVLVSTACGWVIWENGQSRDIEPQDENLSISVLTDINNNGQVVGYGGLFGSPEVCNGADCAILINFEDPE